MKLSAGTIGTVLFTAAGIAVFVLMAKRPAVDGSAMNFGMPISEASVEEKMPEATMPEEAATTTTNTETTTSSTSEASAPNMPATPEVEPVKTEETTSEVTLPSSKELEEKIEEMLKKNKPADVPSAEGTMPAN